MPHPRSLRLATTLTGKYRTPRGFECEVGVDDLSLGGCRVDDLRGGLQLGEYVQVTIGETGPFVAEVAWRQSARVGLQFTRPIPAHVLKELTGVDITASAEPPAEPDPEGPAVPQPYLAQEPTTSPGARTDTSSGSRRRFL
ncbi:MAG: PilZ domain-containing protein [Pseudomonadota bacterium]